jgi:hypothetical protein
VVDDEHKGDAAAHGLQRWQQGYDLREVTREWGRLQLVVVDELESYASAHRDLDGRRDVPRAVHVSGAEMCSEGVRESTAKYFQLQQIEATGHVRDLETGVGAKCANSRDNAPSLWPAGRARFARQPRRGFECNRRAQPARRAGSFCATTSFAC